MLNLTFILLQAMTRKNTMTHIEMSAATAATIVLTCAPKLAVFVLFSSGTALVSGKSPLPPSKPPSRISRAKLVRWEQRHRV